MEITDTLNQLKQLRDERLLEVRRIEQALHYLTDRKAEKHGARHMSIAARKRISEAQKARWSKWNAAKKKLRPRLVA